MFKEFDFTPYFNSAENLANKVLEVYFENERPSYPIDPFKMLTALDVIYQFREFRELEGIYLVPEDENDIAIVGINLNRPITRQRFTAAHELCHHIKDRNKAIACPINPNEKDQNEKFADNFASALLMPKSELRQLANKYKNNGYVSFKDAILIADYFGVSFESCVFNMAYKLSMIDGDITSRTLKKRIHKFQPDKVRERLGIQKPDYTLLKDIIDNYSYYFHNTSKAVWYKFKNDFVYNENRLEGIDIDKVDIGEILTDIRINKQASDYCKSEFKDIIEVVGHALMYDYLMTTNDTISVFQMINLNRMLFQCAPFPEEAGRTRTSNNLVLGTKFETVDWREIPKLMLEVDEMIKTLIKNKSIFSISDYVTEVVKIHHKLTVIHPFADGNGRSSRGMLNWLLKINNLPPVYLKVKEKEFYYNALCKADLDNDYNELSKVFYKEMLRSVAQLA